LAVIKQGNKVMQNYNKSGWSRLGQLMFVTPVIAGLIMLLFSIYFQQEYGKNSFFVFMFGTLQLLSVLVIITSLGIAVSRLALGEPNEHTPKWAKKNSIEE